jgi:hypothetical protein
MVLIVRLNVPYFSGAGPWNRVEKMDPAKSKYHHKRNIKLRVSHSIFNSVFRSFDTDFITRKYAK